MSTLIFIIFGLLAMAICYVLGFIDGQAVATKSADRWLSKIEEMQCEPRVDYTEIELRDLYTASVAFKKSNPHLRLVK